MSESYYDFSTFGDLDVMSDPFFITVMIVVLCIYLVMLVGLVVLYVLRGLGVYNIAKRRGIHHPWLAWIPIGEAWILGSISDQYQYVVKGKIRNRRKILLGIGIASNVISIPVLISEIVAMASIFEELPAGAVASSLLFVVCSLIMAVLSIVYMVFYYMAQFDMYRSCDPNNAVVFLVLGIFFSILQYIFPFACRKKDLGMPPRRTQPAAEPAPLPAQSEPACAEPADISVEPVVEPELPVDANAEPDEMEAEPCTAEEADFAEESANLPENE